jgi:hypothetical protein
MDAATRRVFLFSLVGLLLATSTIVVFQLAPFVPRPPEYGTVSIYLASTPSDISGGQNVAPYAAIIMAPPAGTPASEGSATITSLSVTISSVLVHVSDEGNDSGWIPLSKNSVTIDLLKPTSLSTLLASTQVPQENITTVRLVVSSATATIKDSSGKVTNVSVTVSSGKLEIPLGESAVVKGQMITNIIIGRPHIVQEGNGHIRLTPSLNATITGPK